MRGSNMAGIAVVLGATLMAGLAGAQETTADREDPYWDEATEPEEVAPAPNVNVTPPEAQPVEPRPAPPLRAQRTAPDELAEAPHARPAATDAIERVQPRPMGRESSELRSERPAPRAATNPGASALLGLLNMAEAGRALRVSSEAWLASVDADGDAMISRKEAMVAGQQLVGGVFFRVDQNHDGHLAPIELRAARSILLREHPIVRTLLSSPRASSYSMRQLLSYLDPSGERGMELNEASLAVSTGVDALFAMSDMNRDGRIALSELHVAANKLSESTARAALHAMDADKNGAVSVGELDAAMLQATRQSFVRMDRNGDGMLSPEEATRTPEPKRPLAVNTEPSAQEPASAKDPLDLNRSPTER